MSRSAAAFWWKEELPKEIAYLTKTHPHDEWVPTTYKQLLDKKIENQKCELRRKRRCSSIRAGYIWVFEVPGFFFAGWWIYIKTIEDEYGINFRHERNNDLVVKAMQLFPCGVIPLLEYFDTWAVKFAKQYAHVGFKRKRKQGLVKCWCEISEYGELVDIKPLEK